MRITNGMIRQTTLNGLQRSMTKLNTTFAQMSSGKKIQTVSDDPIIAGRALKLTTNILENAQYKSNTKEATAWAETTATSLENITNMLNTIRDKCVEGATGTMNQNDKESIREQIEQSWQQILQEINMTYAGRYVFTGYKTSEPMAIANLEGYTLDENLDINGNIWIGDKSTIYSGSTLAEGSAISKGSILSGANAELKVEGDIINGKFELGADTIISEEDLFELAGYRRKGADQKLSLAMNDVTIEPGTTLTVEQVQLLENILKECGSLTADAENPEISVLLGMKVEDYKEATYTLGEDESYTIPAGKDISEEYFMKWFGFEKVEASEIPNGEEGTWYRLTKTISNLPDSGSDNYSLRKNLYVGTGCKFEGSINVNGNNTMLNINSTIAEGSNLTAGTTLGKGTLNPKVIGNIENHKIAYEIGTNNTIIVNAEGMDKIMSEMVQKFNEIFNVMDNALVDDTITVTELNKMFTRKIEEVDKMIKDVGGVNTNLGSRINRLSYIESTLTEQRVIYKNLLTETENIDAEEVYTNFSNEYATYTSALQATVRVIMNTLADYL